MNKDYLPSVHYEPEDIERFGIPYAFQDACVDHYVRYRACQQASNAINRMQMLGKLIHNFGCSKPYNQWSRCQAKRERDISAKTAFIIREKLASQYKGAD